MNIPHTNFDAVFKESLTLFKDKTLDFLGLAGVAPIVESLGTESVEIDMTWELKDLVFATQDGKGLHFEAETALSHDDLLRFAGYNIGLSRAHRREFITALLVRDPATLTEIHTAQLRFTPHIIFCADIDADAMLARLKAAVAAGEAINELEAIYLPLFSSKRLTPTELFVASAGVVRDMHADDRKKQKILALLITLAGKVAERAQLDAVAEEVAKMGNVIIEYFEERGEKRGEKRGLELGEKRQKEESAQKMLSDGFDVLDIIRYTGIDAERLDALRKRAPRQMQALR